MECPMVREQLVAYIQSELESDEAEEIRYHLENCMECSQEKLSIDSHLELYHRLPRFEPSDQIWKNIRKQIQEEKTALPKNPSRWKKRLRIAELAFASLILIAISSFYMYFKMWENGVSLLEISGDVLMKTPEIGDWKKFNGKLESPLNSGKDIEIQSLPKSKAILKLPSSINLHLFLDTSIIVHNQNNITLKQGELIVDVERGNKFCVKTKYGDINVMGTTFSINVTSEQAILNVYKGNVLWNNRYGTQIIGPKCISKASLNSPPSPPIQHSLSHIPSWFSSPLAIQVNLLSHNNVKGKPILVNFKIMNVSSSPVTLIPYSRKSPHFLFKVLYKDKIFDTPATPVEFPYQSGEKGRVNLVPGKFYELFCDISEHIKKEGVYQVVGIYQAPISKDNKWPGVLFSEPLRIEIQR